MKIHVSAGAPGKIRVAFAGGPEVEIDNGLGLYDGLHALAAAVDDSQAPTEPAPPAPETAPAVDEGAQ